MPLQIDKLDREDTSTIRITGEVDLYSSPELRSAVSKALSTGKNTVAVDLSNVSYMDSSGVATLVEGLRLGARNGSSFVLLSPSTPVMKVLQLSRLDTVFDIRMQI